MTSKRLHLVLLIALGLLLIGLIGGVYGTNKLLGGQADKLLGLKAKDQALSQEQLTLNQAKKDIKTYEGLNKIAQAVVPQDKNQAEAVQEIVNIASENGVALSSINFPASSLGLLPNGSSTTSGSSGTSATTVTPPASANSKANSLSQLTPVRNIPGVYELPITISNTPNYVQYDKFISFLSDLEHNRRTAQVQSITIQPNVQNRNQLTFNLTLSEYIKP